MSDNPITHVVEAQYESALPVVVGVAVEDHPEEEEPTPWYKDRRTLIVGIIVSVAVAIAVVIAVVIAVIVTLQSSADGSNGDDGEVDLDALTRAPNLISSYMPAYAPTSSPQGVLRNFFYSTNGPSWSSTWDFDSGESYCDYYGITCDDSEQITRIELCCNNLRGSLPSDLGMLSSLTWLGLEINSITGTIPSELGTLSLLVYLDLDRNSITGTIPTELGMLLSLERLDLGPNDITGTIPTELGTLSSLTRLYLDFNDITGVIPSEVGMLSSLTWLWLHINSISGTIPTELCALTNTIIFYDESKLSCNCSGQSYIEGTPCN